MDQDEVDSDRRGGPTSSEKRELVELTPEPGAGRSKVALEWADALQGHMQVTSRSPPSTQ